MRKNVRKIAAILSVTVMAASCMTGCGKQQEVENTTKDGRIKLTLAAIGDDDYNLADYISGFNSSQDKYYVEKSETEYYRSYGDEDEEEEPVEDGIIKLQREVICGEGPDIIDYGTAFCTSDIVGEYVEDLSGYLTKEYGDYNDKFYGNVFDAFSYKGKIYAIPSGFCVKTLVGKEKSLGGLESWDLEQMIDTYNKQQGMKLWVSATQMGVLTDVLIPNMEKYLDWENGKALFDSDSFKELLTFTKGLTTSPGKKPDYNDLAEDKALLFYLYASGEFDVSQVQRIFRDDDVAYIGYPTDDKNGTMVQTGGTTLAISISSKKKEGAWEFIKYVLSDEAQKNVQDGFSVNRKVMQDRLQEAQTPEYTDSDSGEQESSVKAEFYLSEDETIRIYSISEDDAKKTEKLLNSQFCSANIDWKLYYVVLEEAQAYLDDAQELDKTIENIQSRANIYVAERGM